MISTERINRLQSMTLSINSVLRHHEFQMMMARGPEDVIAEIDIVLGYLRQASDDCCRLGEAMCRFPASARELDLLSALAQKSVHRFHRAFERWKNTCLH
ncbi:MAG: hypothetical protein AB1403_00540 [Candidatus Riflebacteria bacterium]